MRLEWLRIELIDVKTVLSSWKSLVSYYITVFHEPRPKNPFAECVQYAFHTAIPVMCIYLYIYMIFCRSTKNNSDPSSLHAPSTSISLGHPWPCHLSSLGTNHCIARTPYKVYCLANALTHSSSHYNLALFAQILMLAHFSCIQHTNLKKKITNILLIYSKPSAIVTR